MPAQPATRTRHHTRPNLDLLQPLPVLHCPWSHLCGLCHRPATIRWENGHPYHRGPLLQDGLLCAPVQAPISKVDCPAASPPRLSPSWDSCGCGLRQGVPVLFCVLAGVLQPAGSQGQPQSNGQTERMDQEMETALWCMVHLLWVEYAHNTLTSSATSLSPFQCAYVYEPPLFPPWKGKHPAPQFKPSSTTVV